MAKPRSPKRKKALKLWIESGRTRVLKGIAEQLNVSAPLIRKWKFEDNWDEQPDTRSRGGQSSNKNATGNKGGPGGPFGNNHAANPFRKFLPDDPEYREILDMIQNMDPLDMIWHGIESSFATLIRMERIMYVENKSETIKELKKQKFEVVDTSTKNEKSFESVLTEEEFEFQWSWDRYMTYVRAQSTTLNELRAGIRQFLSLAPESDERRLKLDLMQAQIEKVKAEAKALGDPDGKSNVQIVDDVQRSGAK